MTSSDSPKIVVLGSINADLVVRCPTLPGPGETVLAHSSAEFGGGKGANQAVAASRAGGQVSMIGRVGDDAFGRTLRAQLEADGIDCGHVTETPHCPSGLALITVDDTGENSIAVVPGANGRLTPEDLDRARPTIEEADVLLVQLEIPLSIVEGGIQIAAEASTQIILDPAPIPRDLSNREMLLSVDLICPNLVEARGLLFPTSERDLPPVEVAQELHRNGAKRVAITMGDQGTLLLSDGEVQRMPPISIKALDTTAAGDAFAGALAVEWVRCGDIRQASRFANAAGAIAASREGAQPSMGTREEILELLSRSDR